MSKLAEKYKSATGRKVLTSEEIGILVVMEAEFLEMRKEIEELKKFVRRNTALANQNSKKGLRYT